MKSEEQGEAETPPIVQNDSYRYRIVENPLTNLQAFMYIIKGTFGTGVLVLPFAFKEAGLIAGCTGTILIGFFSTYCLHILLESKRTICKKMSLPMATYSIAFMLALRCGPRIFRCVSNYSRFVVDSFIIIHQIGSCCVYVLFISINVKDVIDIYTPRPIDLMIYLAFLLLPIILINTIRNITALAPVNIGGNIISSIAFLGTAYYMVLGLPAISERRYFGLFFRYPLFIGTVLFSMECIGVILVVEYSVKKPADFVKIFGVLNASMAVSTIVYLLIGFLGFWQYGEKTKPTVTSNLPSHMYFAQAVQLLYCLAVYVSFAIQSFVTIDIIWNDYLTNYLHKSTHPILWEQFIRISTVFLIFILSSLVPFLNLFVALLGVFSVCSVGIIFPAIMHICVKWPDNFGWCKYILVKDIGIFLTGIAIFCIGCYVTLNEIVETIVNYYLQRH